MKSTNAPSPSPAKPLSPGDRVIAKDTAGVSYDGHLHHREGQQFYVLPDGPRQPFYAFASDIKATGGRQPEFVAVVHPLGIDTMERQRVYIEHRQRNQKT